MDEKYVIQELFCKSMDMAFEKAILDREIMHLIYGREVSLDELLDNFSWKETALSPEEVIENWKRLLVLNLLNRHSNSHKNQLTALVNLFEQQPWNQSSQYFRLLVALNHFLLDMPVPEVGVHLLESGAALIDFKEYSPWYSLPYHPQHLEFGIFLSALGILSKKISLEPYVKRLASWQLNTLDATGIPFYALFTREKDNNRFQSVLLTYLLFRGASCFTKEKKFNFFSRLLSEHLRETYESSPQQIDPLWVLIEKIFVCSEENSEVYELPTQIHDSSTSLIGYRTEQQSVICTLHGGHTGLGYFRDHDIEITNYGPQYSPLDDFEGFGIEGNHLSDHGIRQSILEWNRQGFSQRGCVRMVDQKAPSPINIGVFRGIWLEIAQEYKHSLLNIKASFLGLDGWDLVAFCFFVKSNSCQIGRLSLLPGKLERYDGSIHPIKLEGKKSSLEISAQTLAGSMQVIPLPGGINFWGANFLVAYFLESEFRHYGWTIKRLEE